MQPTASVIFTTYNQPEWLEKVLLGFAAQDRHDFEVIVADDGSGEPTRERIERLRPGLPFPLRHLWQEDDGFRKCEALNGAIAASTADAVPSFSHVEVCERLASPAITCSRRQRERSACGSSRVLISGRRIVVSSPVIASKKSARCDS